MIFGGLKIQPCAAGALKHRPEGGETPRAPSVGGKCIILSRRSCNRLTPEDSSAILRGRRRAHNGAAWGLQHGCSERNPQPQDHTNTHCNQSIQSPDAHKSTLYGNKNGLFLLCACIQDNKVRRAKIFPLSNLWCFSASLHRQAIHLSFLAVVQGANL